MLAWVLLLPCINLILTGEQAMIDVEKLLLILIEIYCKVDDDNKDMIDDILEKNNITKGQVTLH